MKRHKAGCANYRGDVRSMIGEVKGPTTYGDNYLVAVAAEHDAAADRTKVYFAHLGELDKVNDVVIDEFGIVRLSTLAEAVSS